MISSFISSLTDCPQQQEREHMKLRTLVVASLAAAVMFAAGLVANDTHFSLASATAKQSIPHLAQKQAIATTATGDCTLYGSGCLGSYAAGTHGVDGDPATADVLVAGDSIVYRCRFYLRPRLAAAGLSVVFDYWTGRPTEPTVTRVLSYSRIWLPDTFKLVAMSTGTNDVMSPPVMAGQIERMKTIEARLLWGSVYVGRVSTKVPDLRNTGWVNQQIMASGLPTADWFAFLAQKPSRIAAYILPDGTHPTSSVTPTLGDNTGCDAWAAFYTARIVAEVNR
jgi:hypothetical protein